MVQLGNDAFCRLSQDRIKEGPDDFYAILDQDGLYVDTSFAQEHALQWAELEQFEEVQREASWQRLSDIYPES